MVKLINFIFIGIGIYFLASMLSYLVSMAVIRIIHKVKRKGAIYV